MKQIKYILIVLIMAVFLIGMFKAASLFKTPGHVWIGNAEITSGTTLRAGNGTVEYNAGKKLLTITDAEICDSIYAEGGLNIELRGENTFHSGSYGIRVLGDLYVFGDGKLDVSGKSVGILVTGCLSVSERARLSAEGKNKNPIRVWRGVHASPFYTIERNLGRVSFKPPYAVTIDLGYGEPDYLQFKYGENVKQPADPERVGYWFKGWFSDKELTLPFDFTLARCEDVTLYAGWIRIVYVTFDSWGGSDVQGAEIAYGDCAAEPTPPLRDGYTFEGWYADNKLTRRFDFSQPLTEDTIIYAKWAKIAESVYTGIDVARYQLDIDWEAVKASGVNFAIVRAGFRGYGTDGTLNKDDNFEANVLGAQQAGLDVGVYFFSQATTVAEAEEEAQYLIDLLKQTEGCKLTLPVFMDYEIASDSSGRLLGRLYDANLSGEEHAQICLAFCQAIEKAGYTAMVYAGADMLSDTVAQTLKDAGYGVWLASWGVQTRYNGDYSFWQYTNTGKTEGIGAQVDINVRYITSPGRVTGLQAEAVKGTATDGSTGQNPDGQVKITWDKIPGVYGYIIYRYNPKAGGYIEYARTVGAAVTEYTDTTPLDDCRYAVCSYILQSGIDYRGGLSDAVSLPMK